MKWRDIKQYIVKLKRSLVIAALLIFYTDYRRIYLCRTGTWQEVEGLLQSFKQSLGMLVDLPPLKLGLVIFLNNSLKTVAMIVLGAALAIYPSLSLIGNGYLIGIIAYIAHIKAGWGLFFASVIPHGIIEIPMVILGGAMGIHLGVLCH
jgi:stage II sporulation protein M